MIGDIALITVANFLSLRKQRVKMGGILSNIAPAYPAVSPKVVCLAAHSFHCINNLPNIFKDTGIVCKLFADDVKLHCFRSSSQTQLQSALDKMAQWSRI